MSWRDTRFDAAGVAVDLDPSWLMAPLFVRDFLRLRPGGPGPGPLADQPPPERIDDQFLMQTVRVDRTVLLTAAAADWPAWWSEALDFRPGGPAPRQSDLLGFSPALSDLWAQVESWFDRWTSKRRVVDSAPGTEAQRLADLADRAGRSPVPRSIRVLVAPVVGEMFLQPEDDRLVVSSALRARPDRYFELLDPVLTDYFGLTAE